jgi:hypothetical protein
MSGCSFSKAAIDLFIVLWMNHDQTVTVLVSAYAGIDSNTAVTTPPAVIHDFLMFAPPIAAVARLIVWRSSQANDGTRRLLGRAGSLSSSLGARLRRRCAQRRA